jgi:hypothetical protein
MLPQNVCNSVVEYSPHILFPILTNKFNIFIAFYGILFIPQYVLKNNTCEPEEDLNRWKSLFCVINRTYLCLDGFCLDFYY